MKKSLLPLALLLLGVPLSGCPVYDSTNSICYRDVDCPYGDLCDGATGSCYPAPGTTSVSCSAPVECGQNETCSRSGICMTGDCHFASVGCVRGYDCVIADDRWQCLKTGEGTGTGGAAAGSAGETDAGAPASSGAPGVSTGGAPESAGAAGAGASG